MNTTSPTYKPTLLNQRHGAPITMPERRDIVGGLHITRVFSTEAQHPFDAVRWERRDVRVINLATGKVIYERLQVEVPCHWDDNAVRITVEKYLFGNKPGTPEFEDSLKHAFDRIANTYTVWGWEEGYFQELSDAQVYNEELKALLVNQMWAPNSPVWFNLGHWEQWRWGRPDLRSVFKDKGNRAYHAKIHNGVLRATQSENVFSTPQASACFLTQVNDSMESENAGDEQTKVDGILEHLRTEGRIFSSGSGIGINISSLRSSFEPIGGKGRSSGPISFNRGWDRMAAAIKSGGKTRRAARMVLMFADHPDIFDFVRVKKKQEDIAKIILRDHNVQVELNTMAKAKLMEGTAAEKAAARIILALPMANQAQYSPHMDDLLYGETLSDQNANHSVSCKGDFWQAYHNNGETATRWVTDPTRIERRYKPEELLDLMAEAVFENGEPGIHNNDWINLWNPVKSDGDITTSNPCSEYLHLNDTSCNLSSFNLYRFWNATRKAFDADRFAAGVRLAMIAADLNIERGGFPTPQIAIGTYRYRTTGIGYANLGGLLMALGIPYDSDEGRYIAGQITSLLNAAAWKASAEMGTELGTYEAFDRTHQDLDKVLNLHRLSHEVLSKIGESTPTQVHEFLRASYESNRNRLPEAQGLNGLNALEALTQNFVTGQVVSPKLRSFVAEAATRADEMWKLVTSGKKFRNSFTTVLAPTGCLLEGTMVPTTKGLLKLKDLGNTKGAQYQDVNFAVDTDDGNKTASKFYVNGRANTRKIRTEHGYTLQGTEKHQVKIVGADGKFVWKRMADVQNGDLVPMRMNNLVGQPNQVRLPLLPAFHDNEDAAFVPEYMNSALAEFLGYFMGDGSLHEKGIRLCVSNEDTDVVTHLTNLGKTLFGLDAHVETKQKDDTRPSYFSVEFHSVPLRNWIIASGFAKGQPFEGHMGKGKIPHIPRAVLESNDAHVYGSFLRGLFEADGSAFLGLPSVSSANEEFIHDIMSVMLALGMPVTLEDRNTSEKSGKILYRLRLRNGYFMKAWSRWAGFIGERKRSRCKYTYQRTESENIPADIDLIKAMDVNYKDRIPHATLAKGYVTRDSAERLLAADNTSVAALELAHRAQFTYERIDSNVDGGIQSTFDLSVPENVTYVANGFISHNTISAPMGIYDAGTTSAEPDYTLVKYKQLSGGGSMKMFNTLALEGLRTLGYSEELVREAAFEVAGLDGLEMAVGNHAAVIEHLTQRPTAQNIGPVRQAFNRLATNLNEIELLVHALKGKPFAERTEDETLVLDGVAHVEKLPWLDPKHLPTFDCSATNGDGQRSIKHSGHILMLGALQPFLSGSTSKTVNLPESSSKEDIKKSFILAHKCGVKCIAVFRAGSKANAVFYVDTPETRKLKAPYIWNEMVKETEAAIKDIVHEASKPRQHKLPGRRLSQTIKFTIAGQLKGFLTVGCYPDGTCGEIFGRLGQVGSFASSMFEAKCKEMSQSLQFGVPLQDIIEANKHMAFAPDGFCQVGDDNEKDTCEAIRSCSSVIDLMAKILEWLFPETNGFRLRDINHAPCVAPWNGGNTPAPAGSTPVPTAAVQDLVINTKPAPRKPTSLASAQTCPKCHSLAYVQDGKCKVCRGCGYKDGGCGE